MKPVRALLGVLAITCGFMARGQSPSCTLPPANIVAWWRAEGNALDSVSNNNGTFLGNPSYTNGEVGLAFNFDGSSYVQVPSSSSLNIGTSGGFTIEGWIKPTSSCNGPIIEWDSPLGLQLWCQSGLQLFANVTDSGGGSHLVFTGSGVLSATNFQHVALTYDKTSGNAIIYLNAVVVASQNIGTITPQTGTSQVNIGSRSGSTDYGGIIDELSVYSRALSQSEIQSIYDAGSAGKCFIGPPVITGDLTNTYVVYGSNTTMSVTATGAPQLSYQWYFVATNGAGQAGAYAEIIDGFCYASVVTNGGFGYGNVPNVSFVGGGGSGAAGDCTVSNGVVSGIMMTNAGSGYANPPAVVIGAPNGYVYGQTNSTLNITNANQNNLGNYFVVVSDSVGSVTSSVVNLTLLYPPSIVQSPMGFTGSFESSNVLSVVASGTPLLSYQWMFDGTNLVGATNSDYVITNLTLDTAGDYSVEVTNLYGDAVSSPALVALFPTLVSPFTGAVEIWGQDAVLNVGAVGSGSLFYQWYFNGEEIAGATNSTYEFTSIQFTNAGLYNVVVSSEYGNVTNTAYEVVVNPANVSIGLYAGVTIQGTVGNNYIIQSTTNLSDTNSWVTVTNITLTSPIQIWDDNSSDVHNPSNPQKFYQVLPGP